ncbi:MAG TPA: VWA domain-containing protein [Kofleriaceae bacterium]|nr:VWA domain-containing protein [Kofleriaceae bacterium]
MTLLAVTYGWPIAAATIAIVAGVLAGLAVIAYILKMRRRRFEVPFSSLWQRVLREKEATSLWKYLRRILSLLLQLALIGTLLLAVLDPSCGDKDDDARDVVIVVDTSASMKATDVVDGDGKPTTRMALAKQKVLDILAGLGDGDSAMIMRMDGQTTPLTRFEHDLPRLRTTVEQIEASDTPADLHRALAASADALRERQRPMLILVGDGAWDQQALATAYHPGHPERSAAAGGAESKDKRLDTVDLSGIDVAFEPIGESGENVGIVAFNVRRYLANKMSYEVFIEVQNFGELPAKRKLVLYSGDLAIDVKTIELAKGERQRHIYPNRGGGEDHRLRAELTTLDGKPDNFALDDVAHALLPRRKKQTVLLVTKDNLYLEGAMLVYDDIQVDKLLPEEYDQALGNKLLPTYDAVFFDDYTPAKLPPGPTHLVYFHPQGKDSPFPVAHVIQYPRVTEINDTHPVTRWLSMSDVNFDATEVFNIDREAGDVPLLTSVREVMAAATKRDDRKVAAFGFALGGTDLTMRVAFPLLLVNTLDWFAGDDADLITTYPTGQRLKVPIDAGHGVREVLVATPDGKTSRAPLVDGQATFYGHTVGVHTLVAQEGGQPVAQVELAANLTNPAESNIKPIKELVLAGDTDKLEAAPEFSASFRQQLWHYAVFLVFGLLVLEWITYHRRITV